MKVQIGYYNHTDPNAEKIDPALIEATGNAEPTSRLLDGSEDHGYAEEWAEPAVLPDGRECMVMYLFDDDDITDDDGNPLEAEHYPWDHDHIRRVVLVDK